MLSNLLNPPQISDDVVEQHKKKKMNIQKNESSANASVNTDSEKTEQSDSSVPDARLVKMKSLQITEEPQNTEEKKKKKALQTIENEPSASVSVNKNSEEVDSSTKSNSETKIARIQANENLQDLEQSIVTSPLLQALKSKSTPKKVIRVSSKHPENEVQNSINPSSAVKALITRPKNLENWLRNMKLNEF